jgi:hypothetical protein
MPHTSRIQRLLGLLSVVAVVALAGGGMYLWRKPTRHPDVPASPHFDPPPLSTSPFENTAPAATYVGISACAECHKDEYRTYLKTAHSLALADVKESAEPADGTFIHGPSGRTYTVHREGGQLRHREAARDDEGHEYVYADLPVRYLVGSGRHTRSYLVAVDGFLSESPLTWYASRRAWGMSPGYDRPNHKGFERAADGTCLFCHVGQVAEPQREYQRLTFPEQPIGCERCHGPGSLHVAAERDARDRPRPGGAARRHTIVYPARLARPLAEALCAQCHLSSDGMVTVRGRSLTDFRPGLPLSDFCVSYRLDEPDSRMKVVGHVDQMRQSRCYQASEKLTCTTCHDPHTAAGPAKKHQHYLKACQTCHANQGCRLDRKERLRRNPANDCLACHMPQVDTEIPHVAFTHHRIGFHSPATPAAPLAPPARLPELVPCDEVSRFSATDRDRNLGLAYFGLAQRQADPDAADAYRERAWRLLGAVHKAGLPDGEVAAALARLCRDNDADAALRLAQEALADDQLPPKSRVNCLFLVGDVGLQTNRVEVARPALEQLVALRRLSEDWLLLAECRRRGGDLDGTLKALGQAAAIAPFRPDIHGALAQVHEWRGHADEARRERSIAERLAAQSRPTR